MKIIILKKSFLIFILFLGSCPHITSQISVSNLLEVQIGKLPNESVEVFPSIYDRSEVNYRYKEFTLGVTLEQYHTTYENRGYLDLSQVNLNYKKKNWHLKLGNIYETLGRGLLLRSFEIPGALLEDIGFRSRTYFHRDLLGFSAKYTTKRASIQVLRGDVLNNVLPPIFDRNDRRVDLINALSAEIKYYKKQKIGVILMNHQRGGQNDDNLISGILNGPIVKGLNYYFEYASALSESNKYAFYAGINGYKGNLAFSFEYKIYEDFVLGSGINEPPALIKQHTYKVLNRSTHVTNPLNEEGYQMDLIYSFSDRATLNFNHARATNKFETKKDQFQEYFLEYSSSIDNALDYKVFFDFAQDPFKGESDRVSTGVYTDVKINKNLRILPELEFQNFTRSNEKVRNTNLSIGLSINSKFFFSIITEITNDPFIIKDGQSNRIYLGNTIRYQPNYNNTVQLFFGERRGGPLCSAGVCYEILDFKGMEIRWNTRFVK